MKCPKCEIGEITTILLKEKDLESFLCELCGTIWFQDEDINVHTGRPLQSLKRDIDQEYTLTDLPQKNEDTKPVMYPKYK